MQQLSVMVLLIFHPESLIHFNRFKVRRVDSRVDMNIDTDYISYLTNG